MLNAMWFSFWCIFIIYFMDKTTEPDACIGGYLGFSIFGFGMLISPFIYKFIESIIELGGF